MPILTSRLSRGAMLIASLLFLVTGLYRAFPVAAGWSREHGDRILGRVVRAGDPSVRDIALTFDDGPNPDATPRILRALERLHAVATFFVVGRDAQAYPALLRRMQRDGDAIENHSWNHEYTVIETPRAFRRSVAATDQAVFAATGERPAYFRPPYGIRAPWTVHVAHKLGKTVVLWDVPLSHDWEQPGVGAIVSRSLSAAHFGSIIVLHDGDEGRLCAGTPQCDRDQEVAATPAIIAALRIRGMRLVTIPELFAKGMKPRRPIQLAPLERRNVPPLV